MSPATTTYRARPIAAVFSSAFAPSHSAWRPNRRRTPETRLNCSNRAGTPRRCTPPCTTEMISTTTDTVTSVVPMIAGMSDSAVDSAVRAPSTSGCRMTETMPTNCSVPAFAPAPMRVGSMTQKAPIATHADMS